MNALRSVLFALVFYIGSVPVVALAFASIAFGDAAVRHAARRWARWHRWCAHRILRVVSQIEGQLPQYPALVVFKHESMFETIEVLVEFEKPAVVFKQELLAIPVWGHVAKRHGVIPINRAGGSAAMRIMMAAGKAAIADGKPILLFPEGTRVAHGDAPPLGAGMAGLYRMLGLPVVPVALDSGKVWPRGFVKQPGVVTWRVGETIPAGLPREEIERRVHAAINALNIS